MAAELRASGARCATGGGIRGEEDRWDLVVGGIFVGGEEGRADGPGRGLSAGLDREDIGMLRV